ncbi:MAG: MBL fold metallo-hydrolase [Mycobacteriaceae bacterium]
MLIASFPAGMFQTNCYVVARSEGTEAVIIDPGQDAASEVKKILEGSSLTPVAVLLTHGHLDHTWSVQALCEEFEIPAYIHPMDRAMLADPASGIGPTLNQFIAGVIFAEPAEVVEVTDKDALVLAGITFVVDHTPGHTRGSVLFRTSAATDTGPIEVAFTGDTLFQGSIGRSDLPGGNHEQLMESIRKKLLTLEDSTMVLPGHGSTTTIGVERGTNPFLMS